ncbi:MAG: hypothetical protein DRR19_24010 [Candidatus Parabeggiatoa sp. nov. 1]|nr:MAG: hypothetical protein DRR19_24010 [Gammaproteobacteria bacterium]HEC85817.1 hypothetical protein [Thioploca sp.]
MAITGRYLLGLLGFFSPYFHALWKKDVLKRRQPDFLSLAQNDKSEKKLEHLTALAAPQAITL